jgi:hypothetical protein
VVGAGAVARGERRADKRGGHRARVESSRVSIVVAGLSQRCSAASDRALRADLALVQHDLRGYALAKHNSGKQGGSVPLVTCREEAMAVCIGYGRCEVGG